MEEGSEIKSEVNSDKVPEQSEAQGTPDAGENENPLQNFFAPRTEPEPVPAPELISTNDGPTTPDNGPLLPSGEWQQDQQGSVATPEGDFYQPAQPDGRTEPPRDFGQPPTENNFGPGIGGPPGFGGNAPPENNFGPGIGGPPGFGGPAPPEMNEQQQPPMNQGMMFAPPAMNFSGGFMPPMGGMGQNQHFGGMGQNQQFQQPPPGQFQDQHQNFHEQNRNQQHGFDQEPPNKAPRLDQSANDQNAKPESGKFDCRGLDDNCLFDKIVKMSGLPYRITRGEIREFFSPIDLTDVRIEIGK